MYDIIGDVHGHASELLLLLGKLGYRYRDNAYRHPERKVLFLGDYIDRGPDNLLCLEIVRAMVEGGSAIALMGNHEYNAICFHQEDTNGGHLRSHSVKNILQHEATLKSFKENQGLYEDYINWFRTLPMYFEDENVRAVHACWHLAHLEVLREKISGRPLDEELAKKTSDSGSMLYKAVDNVLKGFELDLPNGHSFLDKDGNERFRARVKWWENRNRNTYKKLGLALATDFPVDLQIPSSLHSKIPFYPPGEKPVFFGHYWLKGQPRLASRNACCLDFSVAKGGVLTAYRFDGEQELCEEKLVWV